MSLFIQKKFVSDYLAPICNQIKVEPTACEIFAKTITSKKEGFYTKNSLSFKKIAPPTFSRSYSTLVKGKTPFPDEVLIKSYMEIVDSVPRILMMRSGYFWEYWKVAKVMKNQDLIPLVHGQSQMFRIPYEVLKALDFQHGELLRVPSLEFFQEGDEAVKNLALIAEKIHKYRPLYSLLNHFPSEITSAGRIDHTPSFAPFLLSATMGLREGYNESGLSFVFGDCCKVGQQLVVLPGNRKRLSIDNTFAITNNMIREGMTIKNYPPKKIEEMLDAVLEYYFEALQLPLGQIQVIGVPIEKVSAWTYASGPFGIHTGRPMQEVLDDFSQEKKPKKADQVRLMLTEQALHRDEGVKVINLMDQEAVQHFCKDLPEKSPSEEESLKEFLHEIKVEKKNAEIEIFQSTLKNVIRKVLN